MGSHEPLRVLQVVAYVSRGGAYGGPVSVACDQSQALLTAGVQVELVAGWDGKAQPLALSKLRRFRAWKLHPRSFASLVSPPLLAWGVRHLRDFDVVHVHLARDLLTLPFAIVALLLRCPVVVQTHGMIQPDRRRFVRMLDRAVTAPTLRRARSVIALTEVEAEGLKGLGVRPDQIRRIGNGVPLSLQTSTVSSGPPLVLYASRLAPRKRPVAFVRAAALVHSVLEHVTFEIWGPDGGELEKVMSEIERLSLGDVCRYRGSASNDEIRRLLPQSHVFVLPSKDEPFPMALLEALSAGVPSVITSDTGISEIVERAGAATVTDGSPEGLAAAIIGLLSSPEYWELMAERTRKVVASDFAMSRVVDTLTDVYLAASANSTVPRDAQ